MARKYCISGKMRSVSCVCEHNQIWLVRFDNGSVMDYDDFLETFKLTPSALKGVPRKHYRSFDEDAFRFGSPV